MSDGRPLLTAREVAELLSVSTETVLRWTRLGDVPAFRLPGGALRFRLDELELWLEERAVGATGRACHRPALAAPVTKLARGPTLRASPTPPRHAAPTERDE